MELLSRIEGIDDTNLRRRETEKFLTFFEPGYMGLPLGYCDPGYLCLRSEEEVKCILSEQEAVHKRIESVFGKEIPQAYLKLRERFERNRKHMLYLTALSPSEKRNLPMCEFFPYYDDFDGSIRFSMGDMKVKQKDLELRELKFSPILIKTGGFADIYKAEDNQGRPFALKLFHHGHKLSLDDRLDGKTEFTVEQIKDRVANNLNAFNEESFILPRYIPEGTAYPWYLMDFFPGKDIRELINNSEIEENSDFKARAIHFYSKVLAHLHSKGLIFGDQGWSNVLTDGIRFKICDLDFIRSIDERGLPNCAHVNYAPREHYLEEDYNFSSDLESFALMIHHIINNTPFISHSRDSKRAQATLAMFNRRDFKTKESFPKNLRQVIEPLINYPRNDTLTIQDFQRAIKCDFGLN